MYNDCMKKIYSLHYFRGFAAVAVVLYHITLELQDKFHYVFFWNIFRLGAYGVDFFFLLSGFLIFLIHKDDFGKKRKILPFLKKRFLRIFPTYWIIVIPILLIFLLTRTYVFKETISFWLIFATLSLFPHLIRVIPASWTLTYEWYFYLVFAFLLFFQLNKKMLYSILIFGGFIVALNFSPLSHTFFGNFLLEIPHSPFRFYILEFLFGSLVGYFYTKAKTILHVKALLFLSFVLLTLSFVLLYLFSGAIGAYELFILSIPFLAIIFFSASFEKKYKKKKNILLNLLGDTSYTLYLLHGFILLVLFKFVLIKHLFFSPLSLMFFGVASFFITILVSTLFYFLIETTIWKLKYKKMRMFF